MMVLEEIKKLRLEVETLRGQAQRGHREEREMEEDWEEEGEEVEEGEERGWAAVMPPTMTTAHRTAALQLCDCLQSATPLETVQKLEDKLPKYKGVPLTPTPPGGIRRITSFLLSRKSWRGPCR